MGHILINIFRLLLLYCLVNAGLWVYQEWYYYEDTQQIKTLSRELNVEISEIQALQYSINQEWKVIEQKNTELQELLQNNRIAEYNSNVNPFNQKVEQYDRMVSQYNELIAQYNQKVASVNELIISSGTRRYLYPIESYRQPLYEPLN